MFLLLFCLLVVITLSILSVDRGVGVSAVSAELCFVGIQSPAEGDVVFSNTAPSCSEGTWTLPSAYAAMPFCSPSSGLLPRALMQYLLALFFLGLVMKVSVLDGIWGQNKAVAEEFNTKTDTVFYS